MAETGDGPRWRDGYRILEARVRGLPEALRSGVAALERGPATATSARRGVVTTGLGSSGAHARFLAQLLSETTDEPVQFVPPSTLLEAPPADAARRTLVVVSQGLAPNAQLLLAGRDAWGGVVLCTAASEDGARRAGDDTKARFLGELRASGVEVRRFPAGENEYDTLVRVTGPMAGYWCALDLAENLAPGSHDMRASLEAVCTAIAEVPARLDALAPAFEPACLASNLVLLTSGTYGAMVENLRLKVLEGMLLAPPPVWDLLDVAHGPFQQAFALPTTFLALTRPDAPREGELLVRLASMLAPRRHRLVRLAATLPAPLAIFEHEAFMNELLLRFIAERAVDQIDWPGRGMDVPLYELGAAAVAAPPERRLERMTWPELARLLAAGPRTAVVPLGSTEQHGGHLPFATDTWIGDALAERLCGRFDDAVQCPTIAVGCSSEHLGFPGTLDVRADTLGALLVDLVTSLRRHGFARAFVFSAHGGNYAALGAALPALRLAAAPMQVDAFTDLERLTRVLHETSAAFGVTPEAAGHHAGEMETSVLLGLRPGDVRTTAIEPGFVAPCADPQALFYPDLRLRSPGGCVGDARSARGARAQPYLDAWLGLLAEAYRGETKSA